jgi:hypothetical protein
MIDANAVLEQARTGMAPGNWRVLSARRGYFVQATIIGVVFLVAAVAAAIYLLATGTVFGYGLTDQTSNNVLLVWLVIDMLVLLAVAIFGVVAAIRSLIAMGSADEQKLVLMPEGFVMQRGPSGKNIVAVQYENIVNMKPSVRNGNVYLVMQARGASKPSQISLDGRFGKPKQLAQEITGTFAGVAAARARGQ